ncbi:OmpH family outer membrane protein [Deinococcus maricopensis]|uniref:Outer membrane chaperone Skp (OmpH) n=1 Tax=Deinococcus maricopensis (strain DSM 21211 / LMG 22137 / NRRL B-23946 / LB-34) TaxID=709986 RepID=E8U7F6_DEIML|nr:OmpH family outer membrane protein [Deinococcus maricopensis]ADV66995.1 outer membrane chaperone Skp (OmpH) [Deinococcus maricopensis DSM 21211]
MNAKTALLALGATAALAAPASAQAASTKIGIVNVDTVIAALPGASNYASLRKKADADLAAQAKKISDLQAKVASGKATSADQTTLKNAITAYNTSNANYQKQIQSQFSPLAKKVDAAISAVAKANGYAMIFDYAVAQRSGLVIYANTASTDITSLVVKQVKK